MRRSIKRITLVWMATGCADSAVLEVEDPSSLAGPEVLVTGSREPATLYNGPMENRSECIPIKSGRDVQMYALDGTPTGYRFDGAKWKDGVCPDNWVRVQQYAPIMGGGKTLYFQRGYSGDTATEVGAIRHGHIWVADLQRRPTELLPKAPNGRACTVETSTIVYNNPEGSAGSIPDGLWYKPPLSPLDGSKWKTYGDPPQSQGSVHIGHYNYMLWNWLWTDHTGGGQVRAVLRKNEAIRVCAVEPITSPAYGYGTTTPIGEVMGFYGKARNSDGTVVYGWLVYAWRYAGGAWSYLVSSTPVP